MIQIHADSREQLEQWRAAPFFVPVPTVTVYPGSPRYVPGALPSFDEPVDMPDLVWVKAGEPCETCGGVGKRWIDGRWIAPQSPVLKGDHTLYIESCPDCIGGKPRIAITLPCPNDVACSKCQGTGVADFGDLLPDHSFFETIPCDQCQPPHDEWCETCDGCTDIHEPVTVGVAVIEHGPLPIYDNITRLDPEPDHSFIHYTASGWEVVHVEGDIATGQLPFYPVVVDPASPIGTWGAICRVVTP